MLEFSLLCQPQCQPCGLYSFCRCSRIFCYSHLSSTRCCHGLWLLFPGRIIWLQIADWWVFL